jgi:hypothetical protein
VISVLSDSFIVCVNKCVTQDARLLVRGEGWRVNCTVCVAVNCSRCFVYRVITLRVFLLPDVIMMGQKQLENVESFKYLSSMLTNEGRCTREINH